jgi:peptidyl-prolyl cis-trans isomerase B (cyclophilin B)
VASSKDRQRKLARAKLDRQEARRAVKERRNRRIRAGVGAGAAVLLIAGGVAWLGGAFDKAPETDPTANDICAWTPQNAATTPELKDVGTPPAAGLPTSGTRQMKVVTNLGTITTALDLGTAPCASESMFYLASKKFFDNTDCHEITSFGALRCGDPSGTGRGGPLYTFYNEDVPTPPSPSPSASSGGAKAAPLYPKGTVAMISEVPGNNGSQFLVFLKDYTPKDQALYPVIGKVTAGQDVLAKIAKVPTVANAAGDKVKPKDKILIQSLTVGGVVAGDAPAPAPSASTQS